MASCSKAFQRGLAGTAAVFLRRLAYGVLLGGLAVLAVALALAVLPRLFGYGTLAVNGGSMGETVPKGSLVIARWLAAGEVQPGHVILVNQEDASGMTRPKLHRVVSVQVRGEQTLVQTQGDANATPDPSLYALPSRVWTPARTLPYLGYLLGFLLTPVGWSLAVLLPATLISAGILHSIWRSETGRGVELKARGWAS
jgi:signal peptidase